MMSSDEESGVSDKWPPKPPLLRFKMRVQFSQRFKPPDKTLFSQHNEDVQRDKLISPKVVELKDMTIGWLNNFFELAVATDFEYEVGFPIVMLFIMMPSTLQGFAGMKWTGDCNTDELCRRTMVYLQRSGQM